LFPGQRKPLGGSHLWYVPAKERAYLLRRAVGRGTRVKLRSILLTSGTTIVGLVPLLFQIEHVPFKPFWLLGWELPFTLRWLDSENQDIWQNLALTSIGGLVSSTVLILLVIPPLYYFGTRTGWAFRRLGGWTASGWRRARNALRKTPAVQKA
jgi:hypothetical protein